jgi:hypothetical protein
MMRQKLPNIIYNLSNPASEKFRGIEVNGEVLHWIEDIDEFYGIFGYSSDMRKAGVLPEEFIWDEYTRYAKSNFAVCKLIQLIEYLRFQSPEFLRKYGNRCEEWLTGLEKMRAPDHEECAICKMKSVCSN